MGELVDDYFIDDLAKEARSDASPSKLLGVGGRKLKLKSKRS